MSVRPTSVPRANDIIIIIRYRYIIVYIHYTLGTRRLDIMLYTDNDIYIYSNTPRYRYHVMCIYIMLYYMVVGNIYTYYILKVCECVCVCVSVMWFP